MEEIQGLDHEMKCDNDCICDICQQLRIKYIQEQSLVLKELLLNHRRRLDLTMWERFKEWISK